MLDRLMRPLIDPPLKRIAACLSQADVSANTLSLTGAGIAALAGLALASSWYVPGLALIALNRLLDGLDGAVARETAPTDFGGYLDSLCDYVFYIAVPLGFACAAPQNQFPSLILISSFILTAVSFLAYAALAEKHGLKTEAQGQKSFYYMAGLAEGTETILTFVAFCLWPQHYPLLAYAFATLCLATVAGRVMAAHKVFAIGRIP
ncbi:MAG: CDP-alcohol phosphatidyltransferase family protein [Parvibaculum sp.]|nr:CDP-alcohol phosphatidyltransferase family protein [Parvibaculum sp.]